LTAFVGTGLGLKGEFLVKSGDAGSQAADGKYGGLRLNGTRKRQRQRSPLQLLAAYNAPRTSN
jgi:hypothetical protein